MVKKVIFLVAKILFFVKYKSGIAKEGKDFFTCGEYDFCYPCSKGCFIKS